MIETSSREATVVPAYQEAEQAEHGLEKEGEEAGDSRVRGESQVRRKKKLTAKRRVKGRKGRTTSKSLSRLMRRRIERQAKRKRPDSRGKRSPSSPSHCLMIHLITLTAVPSSATSIPIPCKPFVLLLSVFWSCDSRARQVMQLITSSVRLLALITDWKRGTSSLSSGSAFNGKKVSFFPSSSSFDDRPSRTQRGPGEGI